MATIGKDIHFLRMGMQVQNHLHSAMVEKDMSLDRIDLLTEIVTRTLPATIEVIPW